MGVGVVVALVFATTIVVVTWIWSGAETVWSRRFILKCSTVIFMITQFTDGNTLFAIAMAVELTLTLALSLGRCTIKFILSMPTVCCAITLKSTMDALLVVTLELIGFTLHRTTALLITSVCTVWVTITPPCTVDALKV